MGELFAEYDIFGAFGMTILLTFFSAIGSLLHRHLHRDPARLARRPCCRRSARSTSTPCGTRR